jgi:hypothetical protein
MSIESNISKDEAAAVKADKAAAKAEDSAAAKAVRDAAKREADERAATKAHLSDIILLRGLARAFSPHGAADLAAALDGVANALASGRKLEEPVMVEIAYALKNVPNDWDAMVKKINDLLRPAVLQDRSVAGILTAVERGEVTVDQGQELLRLAPSAEKATVHAPA